MAFATVVSRASGRTTTTNTTSHDISALASASHAAGDLLFVHIAIDGRVNLTPSGTGWKKLIHNYNTTVVTGAIFYKVATSSSESLTLTSSATEQSSHTVLVFRAATSGYKLGIWATAANGSSTNSNPPALTPPAGTQDYTWIATRAGDSTVVATVAPSSFGNLQTLAAAGTGGASTNTAEYEFNASTLDPGTFTSNSEQWVSCTVAIWEQAATGSLDGVVETNASDFDITALGGEDYALFNTDANSGTWQITKSGGGGIISNITQLGATGPAGFIGPSRDITWTDGSPTGSGTSNAIRFYGSTSATGQNGKGGSITVPAGVGLRTVKIYVGGYYCAPQITATLSDDSHPPLLLTTDQTGVDSTLQYVATFTYNAGSAGQTLTLAHFVFNEVDFANADWQGAWVSLEESSAHVTSGALANSGAVVAGSATRYRVHPSSGILAAGGAAIVGSAARIGAAVEHDTSGVLATAGAVIAGSANRFRSHPSSGVMSASGATVSGSASRYRQFTTQGVLATSGAVIQGEAERITPSNEHDASGELSGDGAVISGLAERAGGAEPVLVGGPGVHSRYHKRHDDDEEDEQEEVAQEPVVTPKPAKPKKPSRREQAKVEQALIDELYRIEARDLLIREYLLLVQQHQDDEEAIIALLLAA